MDMDNDYGEHPIHPRGGGHLLGSAVISGDSHSSDGEDSSVQDDELDIFEEVGGWSADQEEEQDPPRDTLLRYNPADPTNADDLYDRNLDDEDEAYVYRNLRGGLQEIVHVREDRTASNGSTGHQQGTRNIPSPTTRPMHVLKPRNSDAVLSCPCCFNIVCMDCQRHQKYSNQFRAMFVMGIVVDWRLRLIYDEDQQRLIPKEEDPHHPTTMIPLEEDELNDFGERKMEGSTTTQFVEGEYFPVLCTNCKTQVAVLDMVKEVYHFHGCLESS